MSSFQAEAEQLKVGRDTSDEHISSLKHAESELTQVRILLILTEFNGLSVMYRLVIILWAGHFWAVSSTVT